MREIKEVTGLKGLAALVVMLSHYVIAFFPAVWNAEYEIAHVPVVEMILHRTPLYFFFNGSQMVNLFWVISGFLIGYAWYNNKDKCILRNRILGRYFKLVVPVSISMIVAYILQVSHLFYNSYASRYTWSEWLGGFYQWESSLPLCIIDGLFGTFFTGSCDYNPILWTLTAEVFGIVFSAFFLLLFVKESENKKRYYSYIWFAIVLNLIYQPLFAFLIGLLVSDIYNYGKRLLEKECFVFLLVALFLGSFLPIWRFIPAEVALTSDVSISIGEIFRSLSAGLLLVCVLNSICFKKIFRMKIFVFLGNISMYLYVFHFIILCSFSCGLFISLINTWRKYYVICALTSIGGGIGITVLISFILKKALDKPIRRIMNKVNDII